MDVAESIKLAREDIAAIGEILVAALQSALVGVVEYLFALLLPSLVQSHKISPVHHATSVARRMAEIMHHQGATSEEWKRGLVAALAHDAALGLTGEGRKIRKADIDRLAEDKRSAEIDAAIQSRRAHMIVGSAFIRNVLTAANAMYAETYTAADIDEISFLIANHDNLSVAEYEALRGGSAARWLPDSGYRSMKWLREADRAWMVTVRGVVDADLARDGLADTPVNRMRRLASNIRRQHEESEIYRRILPDSVFQQFDFRNGTLYRSQAGYEIFQRSISESFGGRVSVAASLGGTKVRVGLVDEAGSVLETAPATDWRAAFGISGENAAESDTLTAGIVALMRRAAALLPPGRVVRYCLATKGPLGRRGGLLLLRPDGRMPNLPFDKYPIAEKLREMVGSPDVIVLHDGGAAALGESSRWGTFPGAADLSAFIIGTGVGLGVISGGLIYDGDPSDPYEDKLGSIGRHLVWCPDCGGGFHYEYRPIGPRSSQAEIAGEEKHLTTRMAGKYLFPRLAGLLLNRKCVSHATYVSVLRDMGLDDIGEDREKLETGIPAGITTAALHGNEWARKQIVDVGQELGTALAVLIRQFPDRAFLDRIVLVSTVAEKFGAGVRGATDDIFIETINEVLGGQQVVRSRYLDRELAAFSRWPI